MISNMILGVGSTLLILLFGRRLFPQEPKALKIIYAIIIGLGVVLTLWLDDVLLYQRIMPYLMHVLNNLRSPT